MPGEFDAVLLPQRVIGLPRVLLRDLQQPVVCELYALPGVSLEVTIGTMVVGDRTVRGVCIHRPGDLIPVFLGDPARGLGIRLLRRILALADENDILSGDRQTVDERHKLQPPGVTHHRLTTLVDVAHDLCRVPILGKEVIGIGRIHDARNNDPILHREVFDHNLSFSSFHSSTTFVEGKVATDLVRSNCQHMPILGRVARKLSCQ